MWDEQPRIVVCVCVSFSLPEGNILNGLPEVLRKDGRLCAAIECGTAFLKFVILPFKFKHMNHTGWHPVCDGSADVMGY